MLTGLSSCTCTEAVISGAQSVESLAVVRELALLTTTTYQIHIATRRFATVR